MMPSNIAAKGDERAAVNRMILLDHPIGGWHARRRSAILKYVAVEIAVILLTIFCFAVLDLYVLGCEKV
jgi:hypothetical protein